MAVLAINAGSVAVIEVFEQWTSPSAGTVSAGHALYHHASTGYATPAGSAVVVSGIAIHDTQWYGHPVTAVRKGLLELGTALNGLDYGSTIYLHGNHGGTAAGALATTPSTAGTYPIGRVHPLFASHSGSTGGTVYPRPVLWVDL